MTVSVVQGYGGQGVPEGEVDSAVDAIAKAARTDKICDGQRLYRSMATGSVSQRANCDVQRESV